MVPDAAGAAAVLVLELLLPELPELLLMQVLRRHMR
jgi:hypothetical protein